MHKNPCDVRLFEATLPNVPPLFSAESGAVVDFYGVVRGNEAGQAIDGIDYEAYREMALHQLSHIAQQAIQKYSLESILLYHRIGYVSAGEPSLFLRVASKHRQKAFEAEQWVIDRLKAAVPIWKHPKPAKPTVS